MTYPKPVIKNLLRTTGLTRLNPRKLSKRYHQEEDGIAAIEFAIIAPVMVMMYFGLAEMASAISVDRGISHGTNVAGDLATQQPELIDKDIEEVLSAALRVMNAESVNKISLEMVSYIRTPNGGTDDSGNPTSDIKVQGKITLNQGAGNFPTFDTNALDSKLLNTNSGIVVTRVSYTYTPLKLRYFDSDITLKETFLLKPRRSDSIVFDNEGNTDISCTATSYLDVNCT